MQPDEALRLRKNRTQFFEANTGGVGRQQGLGSHPRHQVLVERLFGLEVLEYRLDDEVRTTGAVARHVGPKTGSRLFAVLIIPYPLAKQLRGSLHCRGNVLLFTVLERHRVTAQSAPGGNIAAHDASAYHMDMLDLPVRLLPLALELVLQEEDTHQVARRAGAHQLRERACFRLVTGSRRRPAARPQVDHLVGRRVVLLARLGSDLFDQHRLDQRTENTHIKQSLDKWRLLFRWRGRDEFLGCLPPVVFRHDPVDQADLLAFLHRDRIARQH